MNWPHEWTLDGSRRAGEGVRPATRRPEHSLPWPGGAAAGRGAAQEEGAGRVVLAPTASPLALSPDPGLEGGVS